MGNDAIGYFFIILLILIVAPLVFWISSMLYAWVKWLFNDKEKLNASFTVINDIKNPLRGVYEINYLLGSQSNVVIELADKSFKSVQELFSEQQLVGKHSFDFNTQNIKNGIYFLVLKTVNQKITKKIVIDN